MPAVFGVCAMLAVLNLALPALMASFAEGWPQGRPTHGAALGGLLSLLISALVWAALRQAHKAGSKGKSMFDEDRP